MREEERAQQRASLEDYLVRNDIALIKVAFFKERYHGSKEDDSKKMLPRRGFIPLHHKVSGTRLRGLWTDAAPAGGRKQLFVVSHAWMAAEHPDPAGLRLEALVADLQWLKAADDDLVFFDYCSLHQVDQLHPDWDKGQPLPPGHPALRSEVEERQFQSAKRYMDVLYSSSMVQVIVMPEVYDIEKARHLHKRSFRAARQRYIQRGWCGLEFSLATRAENIAASARAVHGRRTHYEDDLVCLDEVDYQALQITVVNCKELDGVYRQRQEFEGAPHFEHEEGKGYLYRKEERRWLVGPILGAADPGSYWAYVESQESSPPGCYWRVPKQPHPDVQVVMMKPSTDTFAISGFAWVRSSGNGLYKEEGFHNGQPYYVNKEGVFIYAQRSGIWVVAPVLGVIGDLVWAQHPNPLSRPPDGDWQVLPIPCSDIQVTRPQTNNLAIIEGFEWRRSAGNGTYAAGGECGGTHYFCNEDRTVFIYRWNEQRWRIAPVLGITGSHVIDEVASNDIVPPTTTSWKRAMLTIRPALHGETIALVGARSSRLPGKARLTCSQDGETWEEVAVVQEGQLELPTPLPARYVRVALERALNFVRCVHELGVAYRRTPDLDDRVEDYPGPGPGHRVPVQMRQGEWIKAEKGWLPLYIDGVRAFEGIIETKEEPWSCTVIGYRSDEVRKASALSNIGLDVGEFESLVESDLAIFSEPDDAPVVIPMYQRRVSPDPRERTFKQLLDRAGRGASKVIQAIREAVKDPDGNIAKMAVELLSCFGPKLYPPDLEDIASLLSSSDGYLREAAAKALGRIGLPGACYARDVYCLLEDYDMGAQVAGAAALAHLGNGATEMAREAASRLASFLHDPDREKRIRACKALSEMGSIGEQHANEVAILLDDVMLPVRQAAILALGGLGASGAHHSGKLVPLLRDSRLRGAVVQTLVQLGTYLDDVRTQLRLEAWYVKRDMLLAMTRCGTESVALSEAIIECLTDHHRDVRLAALSVLAAWPMEAVPVAGRVLRSMLENISEDLDIRAGAEALLTCVPEHG